MSATVILCIISLILSISVFVSEVIACKSINDVNKKLWDLTQRLVSLEIDRDYPDDIKDDELDDIIAGLAPSMEGVEEEAKDLDIHLITPEQYNFERGYNKVELTYDSEKDEVLYHHWVNGRFVIDNVEECIGDAVKFFGIYGSRPELVFVRNNILKADFLITNEQKKPNENITITRGDNNVGE